MPDIRLQFPIRAPRKRVFDVMTTPEGLDAWWTLRSKGEPIERSRYELFFGEGYDWRAVVTRCTPEKEFELEMTEAHPDWLGTRVGFRLEEAGEVITVHFHHLGWPEGNDHYHGSCYCWALYLRLAKRNVELGELVPYPERLDA